MFQNVPMLIALLFLGSISIVIAMTAGFSIYAELVLLLIGVVLNLISIVGLILHLLRARK